MPNPVFERCLRDLKTLAVQHFEKLIRIMNFYHVKHCDRRSCEYCCFYLGLSAVYSKENGKENKSVERIRFFCWVREEIFFKSRRVLHRLASLERRRLTLEKDFNKILANWNSKKEENIPSPMFSQ